MHVKMWYIHEKVWENTISINTRNFLHLISIIFILENERKYAWSPDLPSSY